MRQLRTIASVAALMCGVTVLAGAPGAYADAAVPLYVDNVAGANCSDAGTGTRSQPYCTIATALAALQPSGTLYVTGAYLSHVTVPVSGTPSQPVTISSYPAGKVATFTGSAAGLTIDGKHDVTVTGLNMTTALPGDGTVMVHNSSRITLQNDVFSSNSPAPTVQLTSVSDSSLLGGKAVNGHGGGILLDAATSGVLVKSGYAGASNAPTLPMSDVIDIAGSHNTVLDSVVGGGRRSSIWLESTAAGTVLANNTISGSAGYGISDDGASGTAVTNNSVQNACATGIRVAGAATGVSVQNNVLTANGSPTASCDPAIVQKVDVGVYDAATAGTVVDYNSVYRTNEAFAYAWQTPMALADFRAASGQAAHDTDLNTGAQSATGNLDSANSAAPGYQSTDYQGRPRVNSPQPDTGAGPVTYADRGYTEADQQAVAQLALTVDQASRTATVDASTTIPGWAPIATYTVNFGDGGSPVTRSTPVVSHTYAQSGTYLVTVTVTDTAGLSSNTATATVSLASAVRTIALLSRANNHFVAAEGAGSQPLIADGPTAGSWALFDVLQVGTAGPVVLRAHADNNYVAAVPDSQGTYHLVADQTTIDAHAEFSLVTNADGTVSLLSTAQNRYVTAESGGAAALVVDRTTIGPWEEFSTVDAAHTTVSLHAHADGDFVTAEAAGSKPLIANRPTTGPWEQFDVVDAGSGQVALFSHADGKFVTAEGAGTQPLIANRTSIGVWELFTLVTNPDGSVSLLANADQRYVTADPAGVNPLIANRTAIGAWEEFDLDGTG